MDTIDMRGRLSGWSAGAGTLQRRLADALRTAMERGDLREGDYLPPERALAGQLAVSRTTVVGALTELKALGLVIGEQGRGTRVISPPLSVAARQWSGDLYSAVVPEPFPPDTIHLTSACQALTPRLRQLLRRAPALDGLAGGHGYEPHGLPALRQALARHLGQHDLPTDPDQLVVTTGAQQALSLIAGCFPRASVAVVEELAYPGAFDALRNADLRMVPLAVDQRGAQPTALGELLSRHVRPALVMLAPCVGNPHGVALSDARGREFSRLLAGSGVTLVEDRTLELLTEPERRPRPLARTARRLDVLTVGSLSKAAWGGLRIGWVRCPSPTWVDLLVRAKAVADMGGGVLAQHLAVPIVHQLDDVASDVRTLVRNSFDSLGDAVDELLPGWVVQRPDGGLSSWVTTDLPDTDALAQRGPRRGVTVAPESLFRSDRRPGPHLRIPLIHPPDVNREAVRRLNRAIRDRPEQQ